MEDTYMTQACKKFMVSTMAALALAGVCLTASTHISKADDYVYGDVEYLLTPKQEGYGDLVSFLESLGLNHFDATLYSDSMDMAGRNLKELLAGFKDTTPDKVISAVLSELAKFYNDYSPF